MKVRYTAVTELSHQKTLPRKVISALIYIMNNDENKLVRSVFANALGNQEIGITFIL